jgi:hypothetical protein
MTEQDRNEEPVIDEFPFVELKNTAPPALIEVICMKTQSTITRQPDVAE